MTGYGIVETDWPQSAVRDAGVWSDRWRFRFFEGSVPAREQALGLESPTEEPPVLERQFAANLLLGQRAAGDVLTDPSTVISPTRFDDCWQVPVVDTSFPDVPLHLIRSSKWEGDQGRSVAT
eukprot:10955888-Heterocapsa_arctica.AAC.1